MSNTFSIRELANEFDLTARSLRFYEDKGLLKPARQGTTRRYSDRDRVRLKLTLRGKRLGFTLDECKEIIDIYDRPGSAEEYQLFTLCEKIREHRLMLLSKMRDIEETMVAMDKIEGDCLTALQEQRASR